MRSSSLREGGGSWSQAFGPRVGLGSACLRPHWFSQLTGLVGVWRGEPYRVWSLAIFFKKIMIFKIFFNLLVLLIFGCAGSSLLHTSFLWLQQAGVTLVAVHRLLIMVPSLVAEHGL